jgi:hypothetical protein
MTEDDFLRALPLADRLRIAAVDLAVTGAPVALVQRVWAAGSRGSRPGSSSRCTSCAAALRERVIGRGRDALCLGYSHNLATDV